MPDEKTTSFPTPVKYRWMDAIASEQGPEDPLDRLILMMIAKMMNPDGSRARPSQKRLAVMCGVTRETVNRRLRKLEGDWVGVLKQCGKPTHYLPRFPEGCDAGITPTCEAEITGGVTQGSHDFSISSNTSPAPPPLRAPKTGAQRRRRKPHPDQLPLGRGGSSLQVEQPEREPRPVGDLLQRVLDQTLKGESK